MNQSPSLCVVVSVVVSALLCRSLGESSEEIIVRINPPYLKYVRPNSSFSFFCEISKSLPDFNNEFQADFVFQAPGNRPAVVLVQYTPSINVTEGDKYNAFLNQVMVNEMEGVNLTLIILTVRDLIEGNYTCLVKLKSTGQILAQDSTQLSVLRPIEDLCIKVNDLDEICHLKVDPIEIDEGKFIVTCTAQGSNPAPTVQLYHLDQAIATVDNKTELQETILSKYRSSITATVDVTISSEKQEFICVGKSELNNKTRKFPLKVKKYEPDIVCNKSQAGKGQQNVTLTCLVDLKGQNVTGFSGEFDNQTFSFDQLSQENLAQTEVRIFKTLTNAQDQDFTNFYLILEHANGRRTKHGVVIQTISGVSPARGLATRFIPSRLERLVALGGVLALGCVLAWR